MKVFVAGGTGAIGAHAVPALIGAGHSVTALAGSSERAAVLSAQGATPVSASIFDQAALTDQLRGHEAVVNLTSAIPPIGKFMLARRGEPTIESELRGQLSWSTPRLPRAYLRSYRSR